MNNKKVISEVIIEESGAHSNRGLFLRALLFCLRPVTSHYWFRPIVNNLRHYFDLKKWSHHSDDRVLDWDWTETNFSRFAVVNILINKFQNPTYLEIGCAADDLFNSVPIPIEKKVGVDPFTGGTVRKTSDDFFQANDVQFDVVFIDGLHTYEQVRRDVINSINSLKEGVCWIALHDMLPRSWIEQHNPCISQGAWTGDVWKIAFELVQTEGIEFKILRIDCGVGVIKVDKPEPNKQIVELKDFRKELLHKEFSYYYDNLDKLPIIEWGDAQNWLRN
tara:strand:+ start:396 stop:1226 length:831 start_codon:yes stop_codon:yes gene_type:complete